MDETSPTEPFPRRILSASPVGMGARLLDIRAARSAHDGLRVSGIPERVAREVATRVTAALCSLPGLAPRLGLSVTVVPSVTPSFPEALDLPVALACLHHLGAIPDASLHGWLAVGGLSLSGAVHSTRGILAIAEAASTAGIRKVMVPALVAAEAEVLPGLQVIPVASLSEAVALLTQPDSLQFLRPSNPLPTDGTTLDLADVPGREDVKQGLAVAAAGGHALMLRGPVGSGKAMLARRVPGLLPPMSRAEALETTKLYSFCGLLMDGCGLVTERPFRSPHHTVSDAGLVGGGALCRPGEASLAHNGVLFLDDLPEFRRSTLEPLAMPLQLGEIHLLRPGLAVTFAARLHLVAAMNHCPCGNAGNPPGTGQRCRCTPDAISGYHQRIPPSLAQRFDITLDVPPPDRREDHSVALSSADYRARVEAARERQAHRYAGVPELAHNAQLTAPLVERFCSLTPPATLLLDEALKHEAPSPLARVQLLAVARTCADLHGHEHIHDDDLALALTMPPFALAAARLFRPRT